MQPIKCPETGNMIDPTKTDIAAYAIHLYHLPDRSPDFFLKGWRHDNPDVKARVKILMTAAKQQQAEQPPSEDED